MNNDKFTILKELLTDNRSIRRFDNSRSVESTTLTRLVELATLCASGRNAQPLKYRIVNTREECDLVFPLLAWAGYYTEWTGPAPDERPTAYLIQCLDKSISTNPLCDEGLQLEAITLGATALGLNGCIIKAFKPSIHETLNLPEQIIPTYVLALGYASEKAKIVSINSDGDFKYYRDENDTQCVPKRTLSDLLI